MTQRKFFEHFKLENQAKLRSILARQIFTNRETILSRLVKKMLGVNYKAVNKDPELEHSEIKP